MRSYKAKDKMEVVRECLDDKYGRYDVFFDNGRQMRRARYVMAKFLCAKDLYIPQTLVVHHIDGNVLNDDLANLTLMKRSEHTSMHRVDRPLKYGVRSKNNKRVYRKVHYLANKEKQNDASLGWYYKHKDDPGFREHNKEKCKEWYYKHREEIINKRKEVMSNA